MDESSEARIERLEQMLFAMRERIEQLEHAAAPADRLERTAAPTQVPPATADTAAPTARPLSPVSPVGSTPGTHPPHSGLRATTAGPAAPPRNIPSITSHIARPAPRKPAESGQVELVIGMRLTAWLGAAIVFIGAALLVHLGITSGWWGGLPGGARAVLIALAGMALLAGGEIVLRRVGRTPSVGLFGAGLAVLHLDAWAAHRFFGVLSESGAFLALVLTAAIAFAITLRTRMMSIGVIAIVAAYAVPLLVAPDAGSSIGPDIVLAFYLTLVLGSALALSALDARAFRALRIVAIVGMLVPGTLWLFTSASHPQVAAVATGVWWALVVGEAVLAAVRRQTPAINVIATFLATVFFITGGVIVLSIGFAPGVRWNGLYTLLPAVMAAAVAWQTGGIDALTKHPTDALSKLANALYWQSAALVLAAAAMLAPADMMSVTWLILGLTGIECGRRIDSRVLRTFGLAALILASMRAVTIDAFAGTLAVPLGALPLAGIVTGWTLVMVAVIASWFITALRWTERTPNSSDAPRRATSPGAVTCSWVAAVIGAGFVLAEASSPPAAALLLSIFATAFLVVRCRTVQTGARPIAVTLFVLAGVTITLHPDRLPLALGMPMNVEGPAFRSMWTLGAVVAAAGLFASILLPALRQVPASAAPDPWPRRERLGWAWNWASVALLVALIPELAASISGNKELIRPALSELAFRFTLACCAVSIMHALLAARLRSGILIGAALVTACAAAIIFAGPAAGFAWFDRFEQGPTADTLSPLIHLEMLAAGAVLVALLVAIRLPGRAFPVLRIAAAIAAAATLLLEGTLEIDRLFGEQAALRNAALSLYWGIFGIALVGTGLVRRAAPLRYAGLIMLAIVTAKVLFIDLAALRGVPRILSFFAAGGVLIATSIVYGRLAAAVTGERDPGGRTYKKSGDPIDEGLRSS